MNQASAIRRSKSHHAAAARNTERIEAKFVRRLTIHVDYRRLEEFRLFLRDAGITPRHMVLNEYSAQGEFIVDETKRFKFDRRSPLFTIAKEEKVLAS